MCLYIHLGHHRCKHIIYIDKKPDESLPVSQYVYDFRLSWRLPSLFSFSMSPTSCLASNKIHIYIYICTHVPNQMNRYGLCRHIYLHAHDIIWMHVYICVYRIHNIFIICHDLLRQRLAFLSRVHLRHRWLLAYVYVSSKMNRCSWLACNI